MLVTALNSKTNLEPGNIKIVVSLSHLILKLLWSLNNLLGQFRDFGQTKRKYKEMQRNTKKK